MNCFPAPYFRRIFFLGACLVLLSCSGEEEAKQHAKPFETLSETEKRDAANALSGLSVAEGLTVSTFASEPMLLNPTNIDIDPKGRVWICEAFNYRNHLNPGNPERKKGDRIVILEDTDKDGKADKETVFYQGPEINAAIGIAVLPDRVIVSCSPNVFVFRDTDGDDKADSKEIMFQGIGGVQHDHGAHAFVFGPDGRLYFNFGNEGKQLLDKNGEVVIDIHGFPVKADGKNFHQGMVFRCNPDGSQVEVLAHNFRNNYEMAVDAFGTIWQSDNDDDGNKAVRINFVMEYGNYGFRDQKSGAGWRKIRTGMHEEIPLRHWHLKDPGVVPNLLQTGAGSPTGMVIYEGNLLPEVFQNQMIHCDAGPNVLRSYPVSAKGAGYEAQIVNILKGDKDKWFRPSDVCVAPDGSLIVSDWYDPGVGGHQMGDTARGRLYRIAPAKTPYEIPSFDFSTAAGAVEALGNPNVSVRASAWMALKAMGSEAEGELTKAWNSSNPRLRARALWLLAQIPGKAGTYVEQAIEDKNPNIRITGLRIARQHALALLPYLQKLKNDPSDHVKREVIIALRFLKQAETAELWAEMALQYNGNDRWYLEALGIGSDLNADACFDAWLAKVGDQWNQSKEAQIVWRIRSPKAIPMLADLILQTPSALAAEKYFRAMHFHNEAIVNETLTELLNSGHGQEARINYLALAHMEPAYIKKTGKARRILRRLLRDLKGSDEYLNLVDILELSDEGKRVFEIALGNVGQAVGDRALGLLRSFGQLDRFEKVLRSKDDQEVILGLTSLGRAYADQAYDLLEKFALDKSNPDGQRKVALQNLSNGWAGEGRLAGIIKSGKLSKEMAQAASIHIMGSHRAHIQKIAFDILEIEKSENKLPPIQELMAIEGEIDEGKATFQKYCISCHQVNGQGTDFGPDLSEIGSKLSRSAMFGSIINPSAGIGFGYEGYLITLKDGTRYTGYIASETQEEIDLRMMGGLTQNIKKDQIREKELMNQSLMTPGLHFLMTKEELAGLVAYLQSLKVAQKLALVE